MSKMDKGGALCADRKIWRNRASLKSYYNAISRIIMPYVLKSPMLFYVLNVLYINGISMLLIPSTHTPSGTPLPSTRILRFVPDLALSVGFGPVLFSPKRCLCDNAIHSLPFPVYSISSIVD